MFVVIIQKSSYGNTDHIDIDQQHIAAYISVHTLNMYIFVAWLMVYSCIDCWLINKNLYILKLKKSFKYSNF